jgi:hypothetical protein
MRLARPGGAVADLATRLLSEERRSPGARIPPLSRTESGTSKIIGGGSVRLPPMTSVVLHYQSSGVGRTVGPP